MSITPIRNVRLVGADEDTEMCAVCGNSMGPGKVVVDITTHHETMPYATSDWATCHLGCVDKDGHGRLSSG